MYKRKQEKKVSGKKILNVNYPIEYKSCAK